MPLITFSRVTRDDYHDYLRCPKIIAIKAYVERRRPPGHAAPARRIRRDQRAATRAHSRGPEGEATLTSDSSHGSLEPAEGYLRAAVAAKFQARVTIDVKALFKGMTDGIAKVEAQLKDRYGTLEAIGNGACHMGLAAVQAKPTLLALASGGRVVVVEVKNRYSELEEDMREARWYNAMLRRGAVNLFEERFEAERPVVTPAVRTSRRVETVVVNPPRGSHRVERGALEIEPGTERGIMAAKVLGLRGLFPETACRADCPHVAFAERYGVDFPEGTTEPLPPLAMIMGHGLRRAGHDFDFDYVKKYVGRFVVRERRWGRAEGPGFREDYQRAQTKVLRRLGFPDPIIDRFFEGPRGADVWFEEIRKEVPHEISQWRELLGKERWVTVEPNAFGQARMIYALPRGSAAFVKESGRDWGF